MQINLFWEKIVNEQLREELKSNYQKNDELKNLIETMILKKFNLNNLNKFQNIFLEYLNSYSKCDGIYDLECRQKIQGYRLFIQMKDNFLFLKLKKCIHKKTSLMLKNNYLINDFPEQWIKSDLKKETFGLQNKDRNLLINYFLNILNHTKDIKKKWLFLNGGIGSGKTFLTVFFTNAFINKTNKNVIFINSNNLFNFFRKYIFVKTDDVIKLYNQLHNIDLLVIDDFGNENKLISFRDEFLFPLINERHNKKLLTFFISNFSYEELKDIYTFSSFSKNKSEIIKAKAFFNLFDQNCNFFSLKKLRKGFSK